MLKCVYILIIPESFFIAAQVDMDCTSPFTHEVNFPGTTIISPNHPNNYGDNQDCQIKIAFAEGQRVVIEFIHFNVEHSSSCYYDWVEIRDGSSSSSNLLGSKLCGNMLPQPVVSTGNFLTIVFHTDYSVTLSGFMIKAQLGKL